MRGLVNKVRNGDADALRQLLKEITSPLRARLGPKITPEFQSKLDVEDVLQVTFIEVHLKLARFEDRGEGSFLAWVTTLAENNLRDAKRGLRGESAPPIVKQVDSQSGDPFATLYATMTGCEVTPTRAAEAEEIRRMVREAIAGLPPDYATVVNLYDIEGRPIQEVAEKLGRSTGAVHMLRARAHDRLKGLLGATSQFFSKGA